MKKIALAIACLFVYTLSTQAQILYGTTSAGFYGEGTINKFAPATDLFTVARSFEGIASNPWYTNLIQASDGKLYGMASNGGNNGYGVIFSFDPSDSTYNRLKDFDYINGGVPRGSLMQASNGKLYGMTAGGGSSGAGVIFSFDPSSYTYTKLKDFDVVDGANPFGSLIQASNGKLYGMTYAGGSNNVGVVFSFDPSNLVYKKLKDFDGINGSIPYGSLMQASDGKLYGMTSSGGSSGYGIIFSFNLPTSFFTKLIDLDYENGGDPKGNLIQASNGMLYGITSSGGSDNSGVIFSFDPIFSIYTKLRDFNLPDGANPAGSLFQANNGKLYGLTNSGGNNNEGVLFSFDPSDFTYTKLTDLDGTNGGSPFGSLMQADNGKLYGLTRTGGSGGYGVIFSFDLPSSIYTKLHDFGGTSGVSPSGSPVYASNGKLYGLTTYGGTGNYGVIYSFDLSSSIYTKLHDFDFDNGANPQGSLIQASDGKLYGMTQSGGIGYGVIFSFDLSSLTYTKLKDFKGGSDGRYPVGSLVQASNGKLYGMASEGGGGSSEGDGVIFSFDPATSMYTKLKDFGGEDGIYPYGNLIQASNGKLYGMAQFGGNSSYGVIFSFDPLSGTFNKVRDFDYGTNGINGGNPVGSLIQANNGKLYGMTPKGGIADSGVIFSFDPSTSIYKKLKDFESKDGVNPYGNLMQASDGRLYGMTYVGGSNNLGVVFSFDPSASTYTKLHDYDGVNGAYPYYGSAFIEVKLNGENKPPIVNITSPANNKTYVADADIPLVAEATDPDGSIKKVQFFNGATLLATQNFFPYKYTWHNIPAGDYIFTARATDNKSLVTTSDPVHIKVLPNQLPAVSITSPANNAVYTAPAAIRLSADASDPDGTIKKVQFYNGNTLIATQNYFPYDLTWHPVPAGEYIFTAKAIDDKGGVTTSDNIKVSVTAPNNLMANTGAAGKEKSNVKQFSASTLSLKASPVPAKNILNIYTTGFTRNKKIFISVLSVSGRVIKTIQTLSNPVMQIDVSSLKPGTYSLKVASGDKMLFKRFVKL